MINFLKENYRGILISLIVGIAAHYLALAPYVPGVNGVILAFLVAVVLGNSIKMPASFKEGINYSSGTLLEYAIIFLAFSISFQSIAVLGYSKFVFVFIIVIVSLLATLFLAKKFKSKDSTAWLVGFGTAICGSSAIAALAPVVSEKKEDAGIAIAVVNLLGSVGMIILPFILQFLFTESSQVGFLLGASLQSVGNVVGAGYGLSPEIGDTALTVKLARVALLTPAVIFFSLLVNKNKKDELGNKIKFTLPYYLWIFVGITIVNSVITIPENILEILKLIGTLLLTISMAAIGLKVSFKTLWQSGKMAIGFGLVIFLIQIGVSLAFAAFW
jgi:uncharacterized integral membrane protein (TIGR00698 family)